MTAQPILRLTSTLSVATWTSLLVGAIIGTWMTRTAQGRLVYQLTGSKALLGIVAAAGTAPMLVFSTCGGRRTISPKRSVLICTQSAMISLDDTDDRGPNIMKGSADWSGGRISGLLSCHRCHLT